MKFLKLMITTLRLSMDSSSIARVMTLSTDSPTTCVTCSKDPWLCREETFIVSVLRRDSSITACTVASVLILSKIPSLPIKIKSRSSPMFTVNTSGSAMMHFGFPPCFSIFARQSPKVLETDKRPGSTRIGPRIGGAPLIPLGFIALLW